MSYTPLTCVNICVKYGEKPTGHAIPQLYLLDEEGSLIPV